MPDQSDNLKTSARHVHMLVLLPQFPRRKTARDIKEALEAKGFEISERTVQRDLHKLASWFPIETDGGNPPGWAWSKGAHSPFASFGMDGHTALTFHLVEKHLQQLLPSESINHLKPYFKAAHETLSSHRLKSLKDWLGRVRIINRGVPSKLANISAAVEREVSRALLSGRKVEISYKPTGKAPATYVLDLLGRVVRGGNSYLVGRSDDHSQPRIFAMHRIARATVHHETTRTLPMFDLDGFLDSGNFFFKKSPERIKLVLRLTNKAAETVSELTFGADQTVTVDGSDHSLLTVTVPNNMDLRWWILGFGDVAEVVQPKFLRDELKSTIRAMHKKYAA